MRHYEVWRREPTCISALACNGHAASWITSSFAASMGCGVSDAILRLSLWQPAGMPVMGSSRALKCATVHEGVTRRSEVEFCEVISSVRSGVVAMGAAAGVGRLQSFNPTSSVRGAWCVVRGACGAGFGLSILPDAQQPSTPRLGERWSGRCKVRCKMHNARLSSHVPGSRCVKRSRSTFDAANESRRRALSTVICRVATASMRGFVVKFTGAYPPCRRARLIERAGWRLAHHASATHISDGTPLRKEQRRPDADFVDVNRFTAPTAFPKINSQGSCAGKAPKNMFFFEL